MASRDRMDCFVYLCSSSSGRYAVIPSARPRGMIVTLCSGSEPGRLSDTSACPASWYAMRRRSSSDKTRLRRSRPSITLSFASSRSRMSTTALLRRAASSAASFTMFASSAPARPAVPLAMRSRSTPDPRGILRVCTRRICSRPFTSGMSTTLWRSKRPGRSRAGSRISGRADEQGALGQPPAQPLELLWVLQEVDDLFELLLRFVRARDVGERHLGGVAREQLRLRLAEREGPVPALLHLAQHEDQQAEDQQIRQEAEEEHAERLLLLARPHVDPPGAQRADPGVARLERQQRGEVVEVAPADRHGGLQAAFHLLALGDFDGVDVALVELLGELRIRDVHRLLPPVRGELDERDGAHDQERPERERAKRAGPAEFARRRDAVRHQVRLATYGRWRKFSA